MLNRFKILFLLTALMFATRGVSLVRAEEPKATPHAAVESMATAGHGEHGEGEEVKPALMPPVTGPGSGQTFAQAVWVIVIFVILLAVLYPTAWKNVLAGLKARENRIREDIAGAERQRKQAEATLKQYNDQLAGAETRIRDMLSQATADAEKLATNIRMQAQQEAEEAKERAQRDIEASKDAAIREVYEQTATLSTSIAEKILRRNLNADDQRELVRESLEQLQNVKV